MTHQLLKQAIAQKLLEKEAGFVDRITTPFRRLGVKARRALALEDSTVASAQRLRSQIAKDLRNRRAKDPLKARRYRNLKLVDSSAKHLDGPKLASRGTRPAKLRGDTASQRSANTSRQRTEIQDKGRYKKVTFPGSSRPEQFIKRYPDR